MEAPSPIMCPVLTGDTTLCSIMKGSALAETCSFQPGAMVHCQGMSYPNHRVFCHSHTQVTGVIPIEEAAIASSLDLGILSSILLPCLASNKVS